MKRTALFVFTKLHIIVNFSCTVIMGSLLKLWRFGLVGNVVGHINEVNQRRAQLVLGWVTVSKWVNHLCM